MTTPLICYFLGCATPSAKNRSASDSVVIGKSKINSPFFRENGKNYENQMGN